MKKRALLAIIISIVLLVSITLTLAGCLPQDTTISSQQPFFNAAEATPSDSFIYKDIIRNTMSSTVCIYAGSVSGSKFTKASSGSGTIISADGYVVTNRHVVEGHTAYKIIIIDDNREIFEYDAKLITPPDNTDIDIRVLKIESSAVVGFRPLRFSKNTSLDYGDPCVMIGNPKGVGFMVARAMIANPKVFISKVNMIAIDAPVNPGNSGGALIGSSSEILGVITSRFSADGSLADVTLNVGFAQRPQEVVPYLLKYKELTKALSYWS